MENAKEGNVNATRVGTVNHVTSASVRWVKTKSPATRKASVQSMIKAATAFVLLGVKDQPAICYHALVIKSVQGMASAIKRLETANALGCMLARYVMRGHVQ